MRNVENSVTLEYIKDFIYFNSDLKTEQSYDNYVKYINLRKVMYFILETHENKNKYDDSFIFNIFNNVKENILYFLTLDLKREVKKLIRLKLSEKFKDKTSEYRNSYSKNFSRTLKENMLQMDQENAIIYLLTEEANIDTKTPIEFDSFDMESKKGEIINSLISLYSKNKKVYSTIRGYFTYFLLFIYIKNFEEIVVEIKKMIKKNDFENSLMNTLTKINNFNVDDVDKSNVERMIPIAFLGRLIYYDIPVSPNYKKFLISFFEKNITVKTKITYKNFLTDNKLLQIINGNNHYYYYTLQEYYISKILFFNNKKYLDSNVKNELEISLFNESINQKTFNKIQSLFSTMTEIKNLPESPESKTYIKMILTNHIVNNEIDEELQMLNNFEQLKDLNDKEIQERLNFNFLNQKDKDDVYIQQQLDLFFPKNDIKIKPEFISFYSKRFETKEKQGELQYILKIFEVYRNWDKLTDDEKIGKLITKDIIDEIFNEIIFSFFKHYIKSLFFLTENPEYLKESMDKNIIFYHYKPTIRYYTQDPYEEILSLIKTKLIDLKNLLDTANPLVEDPVVIRTYNILLFTFKKINNFVKTYTINLMEDFEINDEDGIPYLTLMINDNNLFFRNNKLGNFSVVKCVVYSKYISEIHNYINKIEKIKEKHRYSMKKLDIGRLIFGKTIELKRQIMFSETNETNFSKEFPELNKQVENFFIESPVKDENLMQFFIKFHQAFSNYSIEDELLDFEKKILSVCDEEEKVLYLTNRTFLLSDVPDQNIDVIDLKIKRKRNVNDENYSYEEIDIDEDDEEKMDYYDVEKKKMMDKMKKDIESGVYVEHDPEGYDKSRDENIYLKPTQDKTFDYDFDYEQDTSFSYKTEEDMLKLPGKETQSKKKNKILINYFEENYGSTKNIKKLKDTIFTILKEYVNNKSLMSFKFERAQQINKAILESDEKVVKRKDFYNVVKKNVVSKDKKMISQMMDYLSKNNILNTSFVTSQFESNKDIIRKNIIYNERESQELVETYDLTSSGNVMSKEFEIVKYLLEDETLLTDSIKQQKKVIESSLSFKINEKEIVDFVNRYKDKLNQITYKLNLFIKKNDLFQEDSSRKIIEIQVIRMILILFCIIIKPHKFNIDNIVNHTNYNEKSLLGNTVYLINYDLFGTVIKFRKGDKKIKNDKTILYTVKTKNNKTITVRSNEFINVTDLRLNSAVITSGNYKGLNCIVQSYKDYDYPSELISLIQEYEKKLEDDIRDYETFSNLKMEEIKKYKLKPQEQKDMFDERKKNITLLIERYNNLIIKTEYQTNNLKRNVEMINYWISEEKSRENLDTENVSKKDFNEKKRKNIEKMKQDIVEKQTRIKKMEDEIVNYKVNIETAQNNLKKNTLETNHDIKLFLLYKDKQKEMRKLKLKSLRESLKNKMNKYKKFVVTVNYGTKTQRNIYIEPKNVKFINTIDRDLMTDIEPFKHSGKTIYDLISYLFYNLYNVNENLNMKTEFLNYYHKLLENVALLMNNYKRVIIKKHLLYHKDNKTLTTLKTKLQKIESGEEVVTKDIQIKINNTIFNLETKLENLKEYEFVNLKKTKLFTLYGKYMSTIDDPKYKSFSRFYELNIKTLQSLIENKMKDFYSETDKLKYMDKITDMKNKMRFRKKIKKVNDEILNTYFIDN